jgi:endonuclease/exonuclease/phosphatase (EEP) superfamily protein YafD
MKSLPTHRQTPAAPRPGLEQAAGASLAVRATESNDRHMPPGIAANGSPAATSRQTAPVHGWVWRMVYALAWLATLTLATVAALRVFYHDGTYFLTWLNAFTRYLYLPAYACLVWAAWQRRWTLAFLASAVVLCHLVWMAPNFIRDRRFDPPAAAAEKTAAAASPALRIFFANVLQKNKRHDAMFREIAAADPDVLIVAEWGWAWNQAFRKSSLADTYAYGASLRQPRFGMVNIFSKRPLNTDIENVIAGRLVRTADIQLGAQTLRIVGVHAPRPLYATGYDYAGYWGQMVPLLATEPRPLLVIGDFNATEHSRVYQQLRALGLRSAHDDRGRGYATTWPNGVTWLPPIRIDQAFVSPDVECLDIAESRGEGSDHKPLIVDVRIRPPTE